MSITIAVANKIAEVTATESVVAGNTYPVTLSLDSEWTGTLYLRVRFGPQYYDIPFQSSDSSVDVQMPVSYPMVGMGIYSEALEICTNEARLPLLRSILEAGEEVVEFDSDLYTQWQGEVTELLVDDELDSASGRPIANSAVTPILEGALRKDLPNTSQTVAGPVTFGKLTDAYTEISFGTFSGNITAEETLRIASFARPQGATRAMFRIMDTDSAREISTEIYMGTGNSPSGQVKAIANAFLDGEIVVTYDSSNALVNVWIVPGADMALSIKCTFCASGDDYVLRPAQGMAIADMTGQRVIGRARPIEEGSTMNLVGGNKSQAEYPRWYKLASIPVATNSNTGVGGVFMMASLLTSISPVYGILYVSQRAGANNARGQWLCCSDATEQEDIALVIEGGQLEVWGKQRYRWHVWEVGLMAKWTSNSLADRQWTIYVRQDGQAELPSGEGVTVVNPLMPRVPPASALGMMAMASPLDRSQSALDIEKPEGEER